VKKLFSFDIVANVVAMHSYNCCWYLHFYQKTLTWWCWLYMRYHCSCLVPSVVYSVVSEPLPISLLVVNLDVLQQYTVHNVVSHFCNKSVLCRLSTWRYPYLLLSTGACSMAPIAIDQYLLQTLELSSKPAGCAGCHPCCWSMGQTDSRTDRRSTLTLTLLCILCGQHQ